MDWLLGYSTLGEKVLVAVNSRASVGLVSIVQMCLTSKGFSIKTFPMEAPYLAAFTLIENSFYYLVGSRDSGVLKVYRRTGSQVEFEDLTENLTPQSFSNYVTNNTDICPIEVSFFFDYEIQLMDAASFERSQQGAASHEAYKRRQMETASVQLSGQAGSMRAGDHQFQQALAVGVMDRKGAPGVKFDVEGSGYGFRVVRQIPAAKAQQPHSCNMQRP